MRNSSLVKWFCAENISGLKVVTEARGGISYFLRYISVEERSSVGRSQIVRTGGRTGSEHAGTSSVPNPGEKPGGRKSKVSLS